MKVTPKKIELFKRILEQMNDIGFEYYKIDEGYEPTKVIITGFETDTFEASCYNMVSEGFGYEHEDIDRHIDIPYEYLYNPDWQDELRNKIWNKQMEYIRISEEKKAAAELHEQEQSLLQYELLKKRFEGKV